MSDDNAIAIVIAAGVVGVLLVIARALDKMSTKTLIVLQLTLATALTAVWILWL